MEDCTLANQQNRCTYLPKMEEGVWKKSRWHTQSQRLRTANYIIHRQDPLIQLIKRFEKRKAAKGLKSVLKDGKKFAAELDVAFTYDETKTTLTSKGKTTEVEKAALKLIRKSLTRIINNRYKTEYNDQKWLGALTARQYIDVGFAADSLALLQTCKNIPYMVLSFNTSIKQQLLSVAIKRNTNYINKSKTLNVECATKNKKLSHYVYLFGYCAEFIHVTAWQDAKSILLLSTLSVWVWERSLQTTVRTTTGLIENDKAKIMWNTTFSENLQMTAQVRSTWRSMT